MGLKPPPKTRTREEAPPPPTGGVVVPEFTGRRGLLETDERQPIGGMPEDYRAPMSVRGQSADSAERISNQPNRMPLYWTDDEWTPARWSPERIATLQRDLASAGLIGKNDRVTFGVWDPKSAAAYRELLGYANSVGLPADRALDLYASTPEPETVRQPLVKRLTNPADLRSAIKETLTRVAGEAPDEKVEQMIRAYQGQEGAAQETNYAMQETGGTMVDPPSAAAFAEDQARRQMPVETGAVDMVEQLNAMNQWLGFD